jgi:hypothetical protein
MRAWARISVVLVLAAAVLTPTGTAGAADAQPPPPATPGGSVAWTPQGRAVLGRQLLYTGQSGGAYVAWMDPVLTRPVWVGGTGDPGGWPWGGQVAPESQRLLFAGFNGGFQFKDFTGGAVSLGTAYRALEPGVGSLVIYSDGTFTVGAWGRDNDPAKEVVGVRQNLPLLVENGQPTALTGNVGAWGASVAGPATMRSALGVDESGALVWAGGRLTPSALASAIISAGAVRAMQMDINPDWVNFNSYDVDPDGTAHGTGLFGATSADRYLRPDTRDFVVVMVRGMVVPGASAQLSPNGPLKGEARAA